MIDVQSKRRRKLWVIVSAIEQDVMIICIGRIRNQLKTRKVEDELPRKSGHRHSGCGSTRDFKYWRAISLALRLNGVYIPGVEIDLSLPRWYYLQKTCIVPVPFSSSAMSTFSGMT